MHFRWIPIALCLLVAACARTPPPTAQTSANAGQGVSAAAAREPQTPAAQLDWSPVRLEAGDAWLDCSSDYSDGDGRPVLSLDYIALRERVQDCRATGLLRLRYKGKITASFAALVERVAWVAGELGVGNRILDIDSAGGLVEPAIRAGDSIAENDWTIWVREDALCHSACVLVLAAGDMRVIAGKVGIHRMVRVGSTATSRKELGEELRTVADRLRAYLDRNGVAETVLDLMTIVPNRELHVLSPEELDRYGLSGRNAVEDDLDRIRLARRCGNGFLQRRDAFDRAYDRQCLQPAARQRAEEELAREQQAAEAAAVGGQAAEATDAEPVGVDIVDINACGLALRKKFGFPDAQCPADSPLAELDVPGQNASPAVR